MKKTAISALLFVVILCPTTAASITQLERHRLVSHLEFTGSWLLDEVTGLSAAQIAFKPSPEAWSIMQVIEHLVITERVYWQDLQQALKTPPVERITEGSDAEILWYGIDRTQRQKAVPGEEPKGELKNLQAGIDAYRTLHSKLLVYARTTDDDLRAHLVAREGCDAYQWVLLISTHEQRHILQIREIKASTDFPKN